MRVYAMKGVQVVLPHTQQGDQVLPLRVTVVIPGPVQFPEVRMVIAFGLL